MTLTDIFTRLCGTGQAVLDLAPGEVSSGWMDMGALTNRILGGGQIVVARFGCSVSAVCAADPDNTVHLQIVHTPIALATPTTARTFTATFDNTTETVTSAAHGMTNGTRIAITATGGIPTGLAVDTNYYVRDATTNTFKLAASPGGAVVAFTTDGTPTHTVTWYPEVIVSSGPIGFNRLIANEFVRELIIGPHELSRAYPIGRYLYAMFTGVTDITAGTFTCDLVGGLAMDGRPYNKVNYATA